MPIKSKHHNSCPKIPLEIHPPKNRPLLLDDLDPPLSDIDYYDYDNDECDDDIAVHLQGSISCNDNNMADDVVKDEHDDEGYYVMTSRILKNDYYDNDDENDEDVDNDEDEEEHEYYDEDDDAYDDEKKEGEDNDEDDDDDEDEDGEGWGS